MAASAGAIRMGRAFVEIFGDDSKLQRTLKRARTSLNNWSRDLARMGGLLVGATTAAIIPLAKCVKLASDLGETTSKFNAVFGSNADAVREWAEGYRNAVGRSKIETLDALSAFQSFFVGMGFGANQATEMSKEMHQLATDFGSFHNLTDEESLQRFMSGLSGSGEVFDKFGINIKASALDLQLLAMGFPKISQGATETEKVLARMAIISQTMGGAQNSMGDAVRTAGSFSNQLKALRAGAMDLGTAVGEALLPDLLKLVKVSRQAIAGAAKWVEQNKGLVVSLAKGVALMGAAGVALLTLAAVVKVASIGLWVLSTAFTAVRLSTLLAFSPFGRIIGAISLLLSATSQGRQAVSAFASLFEKFGRDATKTWGGIVSAIKSGDIGLAMKIAMAGLELSWARAWNGMTDTFDVWFSGMANAMSFAGAGLLRIWDGFIDGLEAAVTAPVAFFMPEAELMDELKTKRDEKKDTRQETLQGVLQDVEDKKSPRFLKRLQEILKLEAALNDLIAQAADAQAALDGVVTPTTGEEGLSGKDYSDQKEKLDDRTENASAFTRRAARGIGFLLGSKKDPFIENEIRKKTFVDKTTEALEAQKSAAEALAAVKSAPPSEEVAPVVAGAADVPVVPGSPNADAGTNDALEERKRLIAGIAEVLGTNMLTGLPDTPIPVPSDVPEGDKAAPQAVLEDEMVADGLGPQKVDIILGDVPEFDPSAETTSLAHFRDLGLEPGMFGDWMLGELAWFKGSGDTWPGMPEGASEAQLIGGPNIPGRILGDVPPYVPNAPQQSLEHFRTAIERGKGDSSFNDLILEGSSDLLPNMMQEQTNVLKEIKAELETSNTYTD